jgi:hypothetical protein
LPGSGKGGRIRAAGLVVVVGEEAAEEADLGAADVRVAVHLVRVQRHAVLVGVGERIGLHGDETEEIRILVGVSRIGGAIRRTAGGSERGYRQGGEKEEGGKGLK